VLLTSLAERDLRLGENNCHSSVIFNLPHFIIYDTMYLLTAIGLKPGGSTHLHTNNTQNNTNN
jgi:hypothetical protein